MLFSRVEETTVFPGPGLVAALYCDYGVPFEENLEGDKIGAKYFMF